MISTRQCYIFVFAAITGLVIAGCTVGPDYRQPTLSLSTSFHSIEAVAAGRGAATGVGTWWTAFDDPDLTRVVQQAASQNLDLAAAQARLSQSRAFARAANAALFPEVSGNASTTGDRQSLNSPIGTIGRHLPGFSRDVDEETLGVGALWEADLFGGARRSKEAARADFAASAADVAAVRIAVEADAADAYIQIRALQSRLSIALRQEDVETDLVALLKRRTGEGVSPERDLHAAKAELAGVRSSIAPLNVALEAAFNRLDVLIGDQPGTSRARLAAASGVPRAPALDTSARPGDLLRIRPDIIAAERRLSAANARIGASVAAYYPNLSLSALAGFDSLSPSAVLTGASQEAALQAGLRWRLFDFGRIDSEVAAARGREAEALASYRQVVLKATEEVENSFTRLNEFRRQAAALETRIAELDRARRQTAEAYAGGVTSLLEVRDTDRDLLAASDELAQVQANAAQAAVAAFRSLGGTGA